MLKKVQKVGFLKEEKFPKINGLLKFELVQFKLIIK